MQLDGSWFGAQHMGYNHSHTVRKTKDDLLKVMLLVVQFLTVIFSQDGWAFAFSVSVALKPQHKKLSWTFFLMSSEAMFQPSAANCCCWTGLTAKQDAAIENWIKNSKNKIIMYCAHKCEKSVKENVWSRNTVRFKWRRFRVKGYEEQYDLVMFYCASQTN